MNTTASIIHSIVGRRILGLFIACALLPVFGLAFFTLRQVSVKYKLESQQRLKLASKNVAMTILEGLSFIQTELESIRDDLPHSPAPGSSNNTDLRTPRFKAVFLLRSDGTAKSMYGPPVVLGKLTAAQRQHLASGKACLISSPGRTGAPLLFMAIRADSNRPERGMLIGEINSSYLWELAENSLPHLAAATIIGPGGVLLYGSTPTAKEAVQGAVQELSKSSSGSFEFDSEAGTQLASYWSFLFKTEYLHDSWTVVVSTPKTEALGTVKTFTWTFVLVILFTLLIAYLLSSVQIRRILVPLTKLKEGTARVGKGEFSKRIEIISGDEFEEVGRSFNTMADHLADHFKIVENTSNIVRTILTAPDEAGIISGVLTNLQSVVDCKIVGLSVLDHGGTGIATTYLSQLPAGPAETDNQYKTAFLQEEVLRLHENPDVIFIESTSDFTSLLSPMKSQGAMTFSLFPFFIQNHLAGVLVLGYVSFWGQDQEALFRARTIADQVAIALAKARLMMEHEQLNWGTLHALARTVDTKSRWTAGHSERVATLAQDIGQKLGISKRNLDLLHRAGLLHDIGKIGVSEELLDKPGKLTDAEFDLIREHPAKGALILEPINAFTEIIPIVAEHHERFNGKGYPRGLSGESISLGARILAVADVYDALISERPYREGWKLHKVLTYIQEQAGAMFDPEVVQALLLLFPEHVPPDTAANQLFVPGAPVPVLSAQS